MELTELQKLQNLPRRPKRNVINKRWNANQYACNYYNIKFKKNLKNIYQYSFECQPPLPEQSRQMLIEVIKNVENQLKEEIGIFSYKGNMIWGLKQAKNALITLQSYIQLKIESKQTIRQNHLIHLKIARTFNLENDSFITDFGKKILQVLNIKFKQSLRNMDYVQLTRNKYYTRKEIREQQNNIFSQVDLRILRGFSFTFAPLQKHDLKARLNLSTKYIQYRNFLQLMHNCGSKDAQRHLIGKYVMAYYGNFKLYKIQDIDYQKTPLSQFSLHNQQTKMTFKDYFFVKYNLKIKDLKQPMLKVVTKVEKIITKEGKKEKVPSYGYMIPELVKLSGLTDQQVKHKAFRDVQKFSRKKPSQNNIYCEGIRQQLFCEINKDSVFEIGEQLRIQGYELPRIQYQTSGRNMCQKEEINILQRILSPMKLQERSWAFFYGGKNKWIAQGIFKSMQFAQKKLDINIQAPIQIEVNERGQRDFVQKVKNQVLNKKPKFVLILLNQYEERYYSQLKRLFINRFNIPSQFIKSSTVYSKLKTHKSILSIATKLLLQINAKMGFPLWKIIKQNPYWKNNSLIYGALDLKKSQKHKNKCTLSFVGTSNSEMTEFYSDCKFDIAKIEGKLSKNEILLIFIEWLKSYLENEKYLPDEIILFREGSNDYQILHQSEAQIQALKEAIQLTAKQQKKVPSFVYVSVNKRSESKFYESKPIGKGNFSYENPLPGTVILQDLSQGETYDFHLAAQKVTQGTCVPTLYKVLFNNSQIPEDALVELTHEQCYNYANWAGPVRVPSCLQYATKLSSLMAEHLKEPLTCHEKFKKSLFYL